MLAHCGSQRDKRLNKAPPDARAPAVLAHMHAVLDRVAIARPRTKITEGGKPNNASGLVLDQHGVTLSSSPCQPGPPLLDANRIIRIDSCRGRDHVIIDRQNAGKVSVDGWANFPVWPIAQLLHRAPLYRNTSSLIQHSWLYRARSRSSTSLKRRKPPFQDAARGYVRRIGERGKGGEQGTVATKENAVPMIW